MILVLLPNLLRVFDRAIEKTTWKLNMLPDRQASRLEE